jgi:hypothetical protein
MSKLLTLLFLGIMPVLGISLGISHQAVLDGTMMDGGLEFRGSKEGTGRSSPNVI